MEDATKFDKVNGSLDQLNGKAEAPTPKHGGSIESNALLAPAAEAEEQKPGCCKPRCCFGCCRGCKEKYEIAKRYYYASDKLLTYKRDDLADEEKEANKPNRYR